MKKINTLFILSAILSFLFVCSIATFAQVCQGDVVLSSQAEVDAFTCTEIIGNVIISGNDITNLDSLFSLRKIIGMLQLENNPELLNINGLSRLDTIKGALSIRTNNKLKDVDGLSNIQVIGSYSTTDDNIVGNIAIGDNPSLETINAFSSIVVHNGNIDISNNAALKSIDGFQGLVSIVSGGFTVPQALFFTISHNKSLVQINGFSSLSTIDGSNAAAILSIIRNPALKDFNGLSSISTVRSASSYFNGIRIFDNATLENIDGLSGLRYATNSGPLEIIVTNNPLLNDCCALSAYISSGGGNSIITFVENGAGCLSCAPSKCIGSITLSTQAEVDAFTCTEVHGDLRISGDNITNLNSLSSLTKVGRQLSIRSTSNLKTLDGLSALSDVSGGLRIELNSDY